MKNYIYAAPSVGFLKTIFMGDLQKEIFKNIKNTVEFAFMFEIAFIQVSFLQFLLLLKIIWP